MDRLPFLARVSAAVVALRGQTRVVPDESTRMQASYTFPTGQANLQMVRAANPTEYKPDGAAVRAIGFNRHPVVHACIRAIADIVASVPLVVLTERGDVESRVPDAHPLQRLLDYPGLRMTARQMRARYAVDFLGYGNAFFRLERASPTRPPIGLRAVNAESIQSVWVDADGDPRRYDYSEWSGVVANVASSDILHFRDIEMPRPFVPDVFGFPRGATALASMAADNEATAYVRQVVTNDGTPTFAVLMADEATADDANAMQDRYRARVVDRGKRGTPAFFGGVKDIKPLGFTLSDLEFPDLRRVSREDICAAFGVDPRMVGIASATSDAGLSGAQYAEARARLVQHTIEPMLLAIEDELNHWLSPEFGMVYIGYDRDVLRDLVENDKETSERVRSEFRDSLRTWEEARRALKLPALPEPTDTIALGLGLTLVPAATAVIDPRAVQDVPPPPPSAPIVAADDEDDDEDEDEDDDEDAIDGTPVAAVTAQRRSACCGDRAEGDGVTAPAGALWWESMPPEELARDARYQLWTRAMDDLSRQEGPYATEASAQFRDQRKSVGALFGVTSRAARTTAQILAEIERRIRDDYAPGGDYHRAWREAFLRLIGETYMVGARQVGGVGLSFSLQSPSVIAAISARADTLATLVGETTSKGITAAIGAAETAAMSVAETGRLVQASVFNERITDARATVIARTESAAAMSQGNWDQAMAENIYQSKEWLAFSDARTRPTHSEAMAEGRIPMDAAFSNGLQYPLDPGGSAAEVIQCFPAGVAVEGKVIGGLKAFYTGKLREIVTEKGYRLTVTPNHPILTDGGWMAAHALREGDCLFSNRRETVAVPLGVVDDDEQYVPAVIEQVFDALAAYGAVRRVQVAALDLHGDAAHVAGRIDVVGAYGVLEPQTAERVVEGIEEQDFRAAESGIRAAEGEGAFDALGQAVTTATARRVRRGSLATDPDGVGAHLVPFQTLRIGSTAHGDAVDAEASKQDVTTVAGFIADLLETYAADISTDQVVEVRDIDFSGHVYDLQTRDGWIIANNIVTSNCRCVLAYYDTTIEEVPR